jgi:acyl carrier protein
MTEAEAITLIQQALREVVPEWAREFEKLTPELRIKSLALDSILLMEMVGILEKKVGTVFPQEALARVERIRDLARLVSGISTPPPSLADFRKGPL